VVARNFSIVLLFAALLCASVSLWTPTASAVTQKSPKRPTEPPKLRSLPPSHMPVREPVLLELFTSQGCSSCPRADGLLRKLLRHPDLGAHVVPIALHVDYWDGLGWKDRFSDKRWSERQRAYASKRSRTQVKTPSAILNGHRLVPAHRVGLLLSAVQRLLSEKRAGRIEIAVQDAKLAVRVSINAYLRRTVKGRMVNVMVALYEDGLITQVMRGENEGRKLRNDRVVRYMEVVDRIPVLGGSVSRKSVFVPLPPNWKGRRFGVVAFLQEEQTMHVHGTSMVHFGFSGDIPARSIMTPAHKPKSILHQPL
jgi:hypothetical protein